SSVAKNGTTPLHLAAFNGKRTVAEWLIEHGVDVAAVNHDGETPVDMAENKGHKELADMLRSRLPKQVADEEQHRAWNPTQELKENYVKDLERLATDLQEKYKL
ncbi:unnamed protein product, partial [Meganyctiphanes norvegica]